MTILTVKQTGGDYSTLSTALAAADIGDTISIEGAWTVDDSTAVVVSDNNLIIKIGDLNSAHNGYWDTAENHYRLSSISSNHTITISAIGVTVDGLSIKQNGL